MSQGDLEGATIKDLVVMFTAIAVKQNAALEGMKSAEYNRLYRQMERVEAQLKVRQGVSVAR
jgi:enolase